MTFCQIPPLLYRASDGCLNGTNSSKIGQRIAEIQYSVVRLIVYPVGCSSCYKNDCFNFERVSY
jgi:hypothetical protein